MKKPICIGLLLGLALLFTGCRSSDQVEVVTLNPTRSPRTDLIQTSSASMVAESGFSTVLPLDDEARRLGKKVFVKGLANIRRSPRDSAPEYYRLSNGATLYVNPTADKRWLQVRMSRGRSGYVRLDQTSVALSLALAQGSMADEVRLTPRPKPDSEPDVGDGKSKSGGADRDPALDEAINDIQAAFAIADNAMDRLRSEAAGFQGPSANWPTVRESVQQYLNAFQNEFQDVANEIQTLASLSAKLTAIERPAFQALVVHQAEVAEGIQAIQSSLNHMSEGADWTPYIATLNENMLTLSGAVDGLRVNVARLGG